MPFCFAIALASLVFLRWPHPVALKQAEHRSHAWPKRCPCLSESSLSAVPRMGRSTAHRCGRIAAECVGRQRLRPGFGNR
ncbi:hypothetical protein XdyCFBP7245_14595 [Xanthomonas dyei]|uniref:Uncharacterized protein n=1 Tax=Xanthomonas dyei TaxID=743699 RepID=A0A2S7C112_9XANT|nr:hypothetical protein XdyCFBP7245_14595 [Xanthomonas dyei]